jgi:predicted MPP superfamily phosphohydrolase
LWLAVLVFYRFSGDVSGLFVFNNQLVWQDYLIVFPAWWGLVWAIEIFPYFLLFDLSGWLIKIKRNPVNPGFKLEKLSYLKIAIAIFFLIYTGIRTYVDTTQMRVNGSEIVIKKLPDELHGLRLALFGDVHMDRYTGEHKLAKLKKTLQAGQEDLIFFTGDLTSRGIDFLAPVYEIMNQPNSRLGSFACMGDHDFWTAANQIPLRLKNKGWHFLENQHQVITHKNRRILVTGITYVYSKRISTIQFKKLLSSAPEADLKILMVHQPREHLVEIASRYGYHLFLAGHTHGGELVPHIFGFPISPAARETRYWQGRHRFQGLQVVITNGIGRTLAALRYHAPAEITSLTLKKE